MTPQERGKLGAAKRKENKEKQDNNKTTIKPVNNKTQYKWFIIPMYCADLRSSRENFETSNSQFKRVIDEYLEEGYKFSTIAPTSTNGIFIAMIKE